jgi:hypothetical protein
MQVKSVASDGKAGVAYRKTGSFLVNTVDGQLALLGEWLEGVDRICREVWQTQGEAITPEFVREILVPEAMTLIGAREGTIKYVVAAAAQRTHFEDPHGAQRRLAMAVGKLKADVNNHYEIEARELEYRSALTEGYRARHRLQHHSQSIYAKSRRQSWVGVNGKSFITDSCSSQTRRSGLNERRQKIGCCTPTAITRNIRRYGEKRESLGRAFSVCSRAPETGLWMLSDGVSENFLERVRTLAARAGVTLGSPRDTDPEDFWLHRRYLDSLGNNGDQLFCGVQRRRSDTSRLCGFGYVLFAA